MCIVFGCPVRGENTAHLIVLLCFGIAKIRQGRRMGVAVVSVARTHKYLYKMVVAACLVASACAIAIVHALAAAHIMQDAWE